MEGSSRQACMQSVIPLEVGVYERTHRRYMLCDLVTTSPTRMEKGSSRKAAGVSPVDDLK